MAQINRFSRQAANPIFNPLSVEQLSLAPDTAARRDATAMQVASQIDREYDVMNVDAQATQGAVEGLDARIDSFVDTMSERGVTNSDIKSLVKLKRDRDTMYSESGLIGRAQKAKTAFNQNKALLQRQFDKGTISADKYQASIRQAEQGYEGVQSGLAYQDYLANKDVNMADKALKYGLASVKNPNVVNYNGEDLTLTEDGKFYRSQTGNIKYAKEEVIAGKVREAMLGDQELMNDWQQREQLGMLGDRSLNDVISQSANATGKMLAFQQDNRKFNHVGNPGYGAEKPEPASPTGYEALTMIEARGSKPYTIDFNDPSQAFGKRTRAAAISGATKGMTQAGLKLHAEEATKLRSEANALTEAELDKIITKNSDLIQKLNPGIGSKLVDYTVPQKYELLRNVNKSVEDNFVKKFNPTVNPNMYRMWVGGPKAGYQYVSPDKALGDIKRNLDNRVIIDAKTGKRLDSDDYKDLRQGIDDNKKGFVFNGTVGPMSGLNYNQNGKYIPELEGGLMISDNDGNSYLISQSASIQNEPKYADKIKLAESITTLDYSDASQPSTLTVYMQGQPAKLRNDPLEGLMISINGDEIPYKSEYFQYLTTE